MRDLSAPLEESPQWVGVPPETAVGRFHRAHAVESRSAGTDGRSRRTRRITQKLVAHTAAPFGNLRDGTAGGDDLLARAAADLEPTHGHCLRDLSVREHLCRSLAAVDHPRLHQQLVRYLLAFESREVAKPHDLTLDTERARESTLRQPARERHLATLELWLAAAWSMVSRASLDALVPLA